MSWANELYHIYELNCQRKFDDNEPVMLPVAHSTANAQIEITINSDGEFRGAQAVDKKDAVTIIPATEDSATRTSGICPMPFADKLVYIAGDYASYAQGKRSDDSAYFGAYMNQLNQWKSSGHTHPSVKALYAYLDKKSVMSDLVKAGVLKINEDNKKLAPKTKIAGIDQEDSFVRFVIHYPEGVSRTWEDSTLYDSFISFNSSLMGDAQLCYASGTFAPATYKHPSKIRNSGDKAKIMSANDESGFTYRGRFANKEQAVSVSYEYSQKVHNALRWLILKQGESLDSLTVTVWASSMQPVIDIKKKAFDDDEFFDDEQEIPTTAPMYMQMLKKRILGYRDKLELNTKVMIMALDSATTGRINISLYSELEGSDFLNNVERWHSTTAWYRFNAKSKKSIVNSFGLYEIIKCAFGTEQGAFIDCDKKIIRDALIRLIPCVVEGRRVPDDIVKNLCFKASNPSAYDNGYNHRIVVETACAMIRKSIIDFEKPEQEGEYLMAYDSNSTDRSYLYGCLLAIADKAENEALDKNDRYVRVTNARRYWNMFSQRPYQTWNVIYKKLIPYLNKLGKGQTKYLDFINEILDKMTIDEFENDTRLDNVYLLGYSHFTKKMFDKDETVK